MGSPKTADEADDSCRATKSERESIMYRLPTAIFGSFAWSASPACNGAGRLRDQAAAVSIHSIREASIQREDES